MGAERAQNQNKQTNTGPKKQFPFHNRGNKSSVGWIVVQMCLFVPSICELQFSSDRKQTKKQNQRQIEAHI